MRVPAACALALTCLSGAFADVKISRHFTSSGLVPDALFDGKESIAVKKSNARIEQTFRAPSEDVEAPHAVYLIAVSSDGVRKIDTANQVYETVPFSQWREYQLAGLRSGAASEDQAVRSRLTDSKVSAVREAGRETLRKMPTKKTIAELTLLFEDLETKKTIQTRLVETRWISGNPTWIKGQKEATDFFEALTKVSSDTVTSDRIHAMAAEQIAQTLVVDRKEILAAIDSLKKAFPSQTGPVLRTRLEWFIEPGTQLAGVTTPIVEAAAAHPGGKPLFWVSADTDGMATTPLAPSLFKVPVSFNEIPLVVNGQPKQVD